MKSDRPVSALIREGTGSETCGQTLDPDASAQFQTVVLPHLGDALALARWLTGNSHDAEDVVQEACLRALQGIHGYSGGNARAWLLAIVRNTAMTWLKRHRSKGLVLVGDPALLETASLSFTSDPPETVESTLIRRADATDLTAAIAALPLPFREVLVLKDVNGMTYKDIALTLSIPLGTVMSRLSRARLHLAASIAKAAL